MGQMFLSSIYTALANSPAVEDLASWWSYGRVGGVYDHVAPPSEYA